MKNYKGRTALVTGASSGIGKAFAELLTRKGARVILTARSAEALEALAAQLRAAKSPGVAVIPLDLGQPGAAARLHEAVRELGWEVDLLVNNAGFGKWGDLMAIPAAANAEMIQLNVTALVELSRLFLPGMLARQDGGIINVASTAAFAPLPHAAVYSACKSFVLMFSEALYGEVEGSGVHVLCLCPGGTASNFAAVASGAPGTSAPGLASAESVAADGLKAFLKRRMTLISGSNNQMFGILPRLLSRRRTVRMLGKAWGGLLERRGLT